MNFMFEWQDLTQACMVAALTYEMLFLPREHIIHIFEPACNVLFTIWT